MALSEFTERDVEMWLTTIEDTGLEEYIHTLRLRGESRRFDKIARLHRWLGGDYSADDFVQEDDLEGGDIHTKRLQLRKAFLQSYLHDRSGDTIADTGINYSAPHPLSLYLVLELDEDDEVEEERDDERGLRIASQRIGGTPQEVDAEDSVLSTSHTGQLNVES